MKGALLLQKFWGKVSVLGPDECWPWNGATSGGYGAFSHKGRRWVASRFSLGLKLGRDVHREMMACHTCDNPPCVNPRHLYEGTGKQNTADAMARGRQAGLAIENQRKTHCLRGHALEGRNILMRGKWRNCRTCKVARNLSVRRAASAERKALRKSAIGETK